MTRSMKKMLFRILLSAPLLAVVWLLPLQGVWRVAAFLIPYGIIGWDVLYRAGRNLLNGQLFDENFLMALATVGAFATGEYPEGVAVMLFYQIGELFQKYAVGRSRKSIARLMDIKPEIANVYREDSLLEVAPEEVAVGEEIAVKPGERVPLDGIVLEGNSDLNTAALTGESAPRSAGPGDTVISGCVNLSSLLRVQVSKKYEDSTVARILDLVENASARKAKTEQFITRFARIYTPAVVALALLLGLIPPLFMGNWAHWIHRALIFLVVSCPCALVISVPLSFFGGLGGASRQGILIKGSTYLETLANTRVAVFDKTGTLTQGVFTVSDVQPVGVSRETLMEAAALAEQYSDHPIARSLREAYGREISADSVRHTEELPGRGVRSVVGHQVIHAGNERLMRELGLSPASCKAAGTVVHVAMDGAYAGHILISDILKPASAQAIRLLRENGVDKTIMLTGDSQAAADFVADELGIDEVYAQLLPGDKVDRLEQLLAVKHRGAIAFVGDGINDAPVLSRADVGVAMGGMGSDAAIEAADVVLMEDDPRKLAQGIRIARRTMKIVKQNIVFALGVKGLVLLLGAVGLAGMWSAVFADVGVSVIAILNAMRALRAERSPS